MSLGPLIFTPYLRPTPWGGRALGEDFHKPLPDGRPYGESWEISGHPNAVSVVAEGPHAGRTLDDLIDEFAPQLFGSHRLAASEANVRASGRFPLLVKILDCNELLSIQVHPDDDLAGELRRGESGKTECWVVLDAKPEGRVYAGLKDGVSEADLRRHLEAGTTDRCLHHFRPTPGDCLFLKAGTVHAVGDGVVMAEVQQSSDVTFRLFDWNRVGLDGQPRPLHVEDSIRAIDWDAGPRQPSCGTPLDGEDGERLVACEDFTLDRFEATGELPAPPLPSLQIWMVLDGAATLHGPDGYVRECPRGQTVMLPAAAEGYAWHPAGSATLARTSLPA